VGTRPAVIRWTGRMRGVPYRCLSGRPAGPRGGTLSSEDGCATTPLIFAFP
jgi:hypothetical protein